MSLLKTSSLDVLLLKVFSPVILTLKKCESGALMVPHHAHSLQRVVAGMNAEIEAMMAANKAAMEESQEEADVSQEEMATRLVSDIITHQIK